MAEKKEEEARGSAAKAAEKAVEKAEKGAGEKTPVEKKGAEKTPVEKKYSQIRFFSLDKKLLATLEELISMVTDACIDSRNFDSKVHKKIAEDVNDSIIKFLRDMFSILDQGDVNRLILVYLSRFIITDGKQWKDKKSNMGLQCSHEICKFRLNAITMLVRFPEFVQVNHPIMSHWVGHWPTNYVPTRRTREFFSKALQKIESFRLSAFDAGIFPNGAGNVAIPGPSPHWLAEVATDICLNAVGHGDPTIRRRGAAILYELFWSHGHEGGHEGKVKENLSVIASMYITFIVKILGHLNTLSTLPPKSYTKLDIIPCAVFVLQSAPVGLLRALWRKLCRLVVGKGRRDEQFQSSDGSDHAKSDNKATLEPTILDVYGLLNMSLKTIAYEGSENNLEDTPYFGEKKRAWAREYFEREESPNAVPSDADIAAKDAVATSPRGPRSSVNTSSARKWQAHDGSIVIINTSRSIVQETIWMLRPHERNQGKRRVREKALNFSLEDTALFTRAATSLYLHALSLHQSDLVIKKTLTASIEILVAFKLKNFLSAVGHTLQHWMRVILFRCGSRRAAVRMEALEFLHLILRATWDSFGCFARIRRPLLSVVTEVMERIVSFSAFKYGLERTRLGLLPEPLSTEQAEAALSPLCISLDRLLNNSISQNRSFLSALMRLAETLKTLFEAYLAKHSLSTANLRWNQLLNFDEVSTVSSPPPALPSYNPGLSRQYQVFGVSTSNGRELAKNEAIEEALLAAADVFSPLELPRLRLAWLRRLAEFHRRCGHVAEEATCHIAMYQTLNKATRNPDALWAPIRFQPWTNAIDSIYQNINTVEGNGVVDGTNYDPTSLYEGSGGGTFQNLFQRDDFMTPHGTGSKNAWYGVTTYEEYDVFSPISNFRKMEEEMVNGAEIAGKLFQEAGIPNSARFCWSLASHFYAETFNAGRLSHVYQQMSLVIANQVPSVDTSSSMELSSPLGRFYRVWFHGSAPDGLVGAQFVYRANCNVKIGDFGKIVKKVMSALISDVHIDLVLDDGRHDANDGSAATTKRKHYISRPSQRKAFNVSRNEQPVNVGVCQIKVTPLRPILKQEEEIRGSPAWFSKHTETENYSTSANETEAGANDNREVGRRNQSYFAGRKNRNFYSTQNGGKMDCTNKDIIGVNTFTFTQPLEKDKRRGGRDWLRASSGFAEKSLRVTKLKVEKSLPTCVTRAPVAIRTVFNQSPLEAGIEAVCRWCAVLFRTAVAANGISVLGTSNQHGIGTAATKVVADSIHHSRIKDIGKELLTQTNYAVTEEEDENGENIAGLSKYERLSDAEVIKFKMRLARGILLFMELLHVLITRNRDLLLAVIRDKNYGGKSVGHQTPINLSPADQSRGNMSVCSESVTDSPSSKASVYTFADEVSVDDHSMFSSTSGRKQRKPDAGIMIQRELQKRYTAMARVLHPLILTVLKDETPQWLKDCCSDSYFKLGIYWETNVSMGEELFFGRSNANNLMRDQRQPRLTFRGSKSPSQLGNDTMMSNEITTPSLSKKKANAHHPSDTYKPGGSPIESSFEID